jgi:hypothetical protein
MSARFFSVPTVDWLAPIDHRAIERGPAAKRRAASSIACAGTPQTSAARAAGHCAAIARACSQPVVWCSRKCSSVRPSRSITPSIALSSARSVPGRTARCSCDSPAVAVGRGSTQIAKAPSPMRSRMRDHTIGWQAAVLVPSSRKQSASARSA